ncbi:LPS export ABC transporter periplasmic protein LptC [Saccharospirillum salsuginis]|uniref:Lipopolysaccharide export system protein LptC n=1 Tax=Saccharospirillum salsuginis TaxID=418750 RepID=A0A918NG09_9GAMM|nr:LPS export ABC transporter periplasmic protein LptC [Saccharospirillum salsuginis]GGX70264.1 hypothetical protein GCM10007392_42400 [Saccharospirillum salsuginis]
MAIWSRRLLWAAALGVLAWVIWWQPVDRERLTTDRLDLPENPPDLYIQQLNQTRFDETGQPVMRTRADTLAYYEADEESLITEPVVNLLNDDPNRSDWRIVSRTATLYNNGDTLFEQDVVVREQTNDMPSVLETEWLKVEQDGAFATTPRPVKLTQGPQIATGVGMDAVLAGDDPVITLKSEVAIRYEADSP